MSKTLCYTDASSARRSKLKYVSTTILCSTAMLFTGNAAYSQTAQAQADNNPEERIVVTGSRLIRSDLTAPSPTAVMNAADLRAAGNITIEETLNELPQLQAAGTAQNNADNGSGVLTANLRGLGDTRTLVLVNGRRFIPAASTGIVDLTNIPDALVKRVEIMTGGASAVYGSDAIAGAVNFILDDSFEGIEAGYQYGQTTAGDGENHKIDLTVGGNFADGRGNIVFSGSYSKRNPVFMADRDFSAVSLFDLGGELVPGGSGNIPGTRIGLTADQRASFNGLDLSDGGPAGCASVRGIRFGAGGEVLPFCDPEDRFNFSPLNYLIRPLERFQLTSLGHYDITDNVTAYVETHFAHHRNSYQQAPEAFSPTTQGDPDDNLVINDYLNNPILPEPVRDMITANTAIFDPTNSGNATFTSKGRRANEIGPRHFQFEKTSFSVTSGLRGEFSINDNPWSWDTNYTFQRGYTSEYTTGEISGLALTLGLDAIDDGSGNAVCRNNLIGCVPVNIFGLDSITPEMADFISPPHGSSHLFQRQIVSAVATGDLFEMPAGPVATAFGVEYRKDQYDFRPDAAEASGQFGSTPRLPSSDAYDVKEAFFESRLPLVSDAPFAEELALEVAGRYSDYSSIGSGWTYKVGAEWAPVSQFRFRGAYNRAVRAPNLNDLFSPISGGFTSGSDPCDVDNSPSAADQALCVQQGVPQGDIATFQQIGLGVTQRTGGNPNLQEEKSDTFTIGAVWRPEAIEGLNVTLDYYKIKVKDAISTINAQSMMDACFSSGDNSSIFCQNIVRNSTTGQIRRVNAQRENLASLEVSGIDFQVDYNFDVDGLALAGESATIFLQSVIGWQFDDTETAFEGDTPVDCAGVFGGVCSGQGTPISANMKAIVNATWMSGPATVRMQGRYIGGLDRLGGPGDNAVNSIGGQFYFDLNGSYAFGEDQNIEVYGGFTNLFNKQPPVLGFFDVGDSNTDPSLYDTIGRRFTMGVRAKF